MADRSISLVFGTALLAIASVAARADGSVDSAEEKARAAECAAFRRACERCGQDAAGMSVGLASSMANVRPRADIIPAVPLRGVYVRLARGESESVQIVVMPGDSGLRNVRVSVSDLERRGGSFFGLFGDTLPAKNIDCSVVGYVLTTNRPPYRVGFWPEAGVRKCERVKPGWWPDPILDFMDSTDIAQGDVQSFWIRVRCPRDQPAGEYRGVLAVAADNAGVFRVPFRARVYDFSVPESSPLPLAITFAPPRSGEPGRIVAAREAEWGDFLSDYYITMDSLYHRGDIRWDVLQDLRKRGRLGYFNLGYWDGLGDGPGAEAKWRGTTLARLRDAYSRAKELDLLDHAYVYGCDEAKTNSFDDVRRAAEILKKELPGVPISTTALDFDYGVGTKLSAIDWFTPLTKYFDPEKARISRRAGHQVWWYICCIPPAPHANMFVECPLIEGRFLMGAAAVRQRPDGFLYYQTAAWKSPGCITSGPFTDWNACTWQTFNGDGCWTCVGPNGRPLATMRLENFRDGLEDYAYAMKLEELLRKRRPGRNDRWAGRARELLAVPARVMKSMTEFTGDPNDILEWRDEMAELIESF